MPGISAEQVRAQVHRFWKAYCTRSAQAIEEMYFSNAIVFSASARRSESAQIALARRAREFREGNTSMTADIRSMDVQIVGNTAIATYDYQFSRSSVNRNGNREIMEVPFALGTQVFQPGPDGVARIVHEHFSAAEEAKRRVLPKEAVVVGASKDESAMPPQFGEYPAADWMPARNAAISAEDIRTEVRKYWQLYSNKSKDELEQMYFPSAIVFVAGVRRGELASLASARRAREFFGPQSSVSSQLGSVDVQIVERDLAIASYSFHWHMVRILATGKRVDIEVPFGRASYIFRKDDRGVLRIFHEHKSSAGQAVIKDLPAERSAFAGKQS